MSIYKASMHTLWITYDYDYFILLPPSTSAASLTPLSYGGQASHKKCVQYVFS